MQTTVIDRSERETLHRHFGWLFEEQQRAISVPADEPPNPELLGLCCAVLGELDLEPQAQYRLTMSPELVAHLYLHAGLSRDRAKAWRKATARRLTVRASQIIEEAEDAANVMASLVERAQAVA